MNLCGNRSHGKIFSWLYLSRPFCILILQLTASKQCNSSHLIRKEESMTDCRYQIENKHMKGLAQGYTLCGQILFRDFITYLLFKFTFGWLCTPRGCVGCLWFIEIAQQLQNMAPWGHLSFCTINNKRQLQFRKRATRSWGNRDGPHRGL